MEQVDTRNTKSFTTLNVHRGTKRNYDRYSKRRKLDLATVAAVAIKALELLPREQQESLIEKA
jgi:hypothetical protein